jgi:hypothetical protein
MQLEYIIPKIDHINLLEIGEAISMKQKMFFAILLAYCFFLMGCEPIVKHDPKNVLLFEISSDKQIYRMDEKIWLTVSLTNQSDDPILVYAKFSFVDYKAPSSVSLGFLQILDPTGKIVISNPDIHAEINWVPAKDDFVTLRPNQSTPRSFYISSDTHELTGIGTYKVWAVYANLFDPGDVAANSEDARIAWKGELTSNTISIEIQPREVRSP